MKNRAGGGNPHRNAKLDKRNARLPLTRCLYVTAAVRAETGLTDGGLSGWRQFHTRAIISHTIVRAGTHWTTGAEQTQPFTLLPVAWVRH